MSTSSPVRIVLRSLVLLSLSTCTGNTKDDVELPEPEPIYQSNLPEVKVALSTTFDVARWPDVNLLIARSSVHAKTSDREAAYSTVVSLLGFLVSEFGSPRLSNDRIVIRFENSVAYHALTHVKENGTRILRIESINLITSQQHFVVHELFHAYFQWDRFFAWGEWEVEKWATYAQYRFKYRGLENKEIYKTLVREFHIVQNDLEQQYSKNRIWSSENEDIIRKKYIIASLELFKLSHSEVFRLYRNIIAGGRQVIG